MQPTATHDDRFVLRPIRAAVIVLLLTLSAVGSARAQRQMKVADRPEPQRPPGVVYVGGSSPTTPLRGTFYAVQPSAEQRAYAARYVNLTYEPTEPLELVDGGSNLQPMAVAPEAGWSVAPAAARANAPLISFETQDFDDNITTTGGSIFIPPDPHGAAGPSDVVVVNNVSLASYDKATGAVSGLALQSLKTFFGATTFTFDPKVVYDPFDNRFVVVTLEKEDMADGATANASRILLAASPVGTPSGTWTALSIDALLTIDSQDSWCDYPGLAVDEEAVYITCNYFTFGGSPSNTGQRLWTVDKAKFYAGTITGSDIFVYDPATATGLFDVTMMPAQVHSNPGGSIGTWLVGYSGLSNSVDEFYQVIRVDNPLGGGSASFSGSFINLGNVDDTGTGFSDAPQSGTATRVETNDRRLLDAVWHDNGTEQRLWGVTTMIPPTGSDAGHETVFFAGIDTGTGTLAVATSGYVGAEDLGTSTYTFFPSIDLNDACGVIGFAASNASMFPGAFYVGFNPVTGATGSTLTLRVGDDYYVRTFGGSKNRWGDYTATVLDFDDQATFWIFNEYAQVRGTVDSRGEDGRWGQRAAEEQCGGVLPVELGRLDARVDGPAVMLAWQTYSETNNAGFEVQMRRSEAPATDWTVLGFVPGAGTTHEAQRYTYRVDNLPPGPVVFRLRQTDFDGTFSYSENVEVFVPLPGAYVLSEAYPNPFNPQTRFTLMVRTEQNVTVRVFDVLGREVARLHDGPLAPDVVHPFTFTAEELAGGLYVLHVEGETFRAVRTLMLVR